MRRPIVTIVATTALVLAGCTSIQGGDPRPAPPPSGSPASSGATLLQALVTLPAGSAVVEFSDEAAKLKRWNITRPVKATDTEVLHRYFDQSRSFPGASAESLPELTTLMLGDGWGWSWLDVDWSIVVTGAGPPHSVVKLRDDLDMSVVTRSLKNNYDESGPVDQPVYTLDLAKVKGTAAVPFIAPVTVLPGKHLLVVGASPAPFLAAIDGKAASMSSDPTVLALTAATGPAVYLMLRTGGQACTVSQPPGQLSRQPVAELTAPTALALAVIDATHGKVVARYADADAAQADRSRRETLLGKGESLVSRQPYAKLLGPVTLRQSGPDLSYDFAALPRPDILATMTQQRDDPWALC